jgi:two-component system, NtrC family, sensor kinase
LPNLFEPFFTTRERGHSLGLGLAISRNIIERHRGRIEVQSQPGRGTVFTITLPLRAQELIPAGETAEPVPAGQRGEPS